MSLELKRNGRSYFIQEARGWTFAKGVNNRLSWAVEEVVAGRGKFIGVYPTKRKAVAAIDALVN